MKHNANKFLHIILIAAMSLYSACHNTSSPGENKENLLLEEADQSSNQEEYIITKEQFTTAGMKIGGTSVFQFQESISANGYIMPSPNGHAKVSSLIPGKVRKVFVSPGEEIKKGDLLFSLEGNEIIILQQEYAEAYSKMLMLKSNFERQKVLSEEQISAEKELILAESEYNGMLARTRGLEERLKMISLNPEQIKNGIISGQINIYAPIKGFISKLDLVVGESIDQTHMVIEIIDPENFLLNISVFRKDIGSLLTGQQVYFYEPNKKETIYKASLTHVGKTIDNDTKTVVCIARLNPSDRNKFVSNSFVETKIVTCQRETVALPAGAVIEDSDQYYVLIKLDENETRYIFRKTLVKTGVFQNNLVEILNENLENVL
ncbi:MAG: efflux RND transporter periplasmic adaptor subunit, partial [Bacteroidales bacterium]|nr:efflux RND transporter periplasmic adaptor subunit [Bacteroidales bacterium]